ncbi:hypothetical protein PLESTM_002046900 [Pleodorina starrii]|nr:hypothetical protein PLESTM_002046900 [Pleodorina starrii]
MAAAAAEFAGVAAATDALANHYLEDSWAYELALLTALPTASVYNVSSAAHNCALLALSLGVYRNGVGRGDRGRAVLKPMLESAARDHGVALRHACRQAVEEHYEEEMARPEDRQDPELVAVLEEALLQLTGRAANVAGESTSDFLAPDAPKLWLDRVCGQSFDVVVLESPVIDPFQVAPPSWPGIRGRLLLSPTSKKALIAAREAARPPRVMPQPVVLDAARTVVLMCTASHFGLVTLGGSVLELVYDVGLKGEDLQRPPLVSVRLQAGQGDGEYAAVNRMMRAYVDTAARAFSAGRRQQDMNAADSSAGAHDSRGHAGAPASVSPPAGKAGVVEPCSMHGAAGSPQGAKGKRTQAPGPELSSSPAIPQHKAARTAQGSVPSGAPTAFPVVGTGLGPRTTAPCTPGNAPSTSGPGVTPAAASAATGKPGVAEEHAHVGATGVPHGASGKRSQARGPQASSAQPSPQHKVARVAQGTVPAGSCDGLTKEAARIVRKPVGRFVGDELMFNQPEVSMAAPLRALGPDGGSAKLQGPGRGAAAKFTDGEPATQAVATGRKGAHPVPGSTVAVPTEAGAKKVVRQEAAAVQEAMEDDEGNLEDAVGLYGEGVPFVPGSQQSVEFVLEVQGCGGARPANPVLRIVDSSSSDSEDAGGDARSPTDDSDDQADAADGGAGGSRGGGSQRAAPGDDGYNGASDDEAAIGAGIARLTWTDEKTTHYAGYKESSDMYDRYEGEGWDFLRERPAYWVYRLLVMRGVFQGADRDPIAAGGLRRGDAILVRDSAKDYFLLCEALSEDWVDTLPVGVATLGIWTKTILKRMGCPPRGYSAHRRGSVTRGVILDILNNRGTGLSEDTMNAICRLGGWDSVTGIRTVMKVYAARIMDRYVSGAALTLGRVGTAAEWDTRKQEYMGTVQWPAKQIWEAGSVLHPLPMRHAMRWERAVAQRREMLSKACAELLKLVLQDTDEMPVLRYREARASYARVMRKGPEQARVQYAELVEQIQDLRKGRRPLRLAAVAHSRALLMAAWGARQRRRLVPSVSHMEDGLRGVVIGRREWGQQGQQSMPLWQGVFFVDFGGPSG